MRLCAMVRYRGRTGDNMTAMRLAALMCCVCATAAAALSVALAMSHTAYGHGHESCGASCAACESAAAARELFKQIYASAAATPLPESKYFFAFLLTQILYNSSTHTLINLKIRLNN